MTSLYDIALCTAPCDGYNCGQHATCRPDGDEAMCICDDGWSYDPTDIASGCKGTNPCDINSQIHFISRKIYLIMFNW